MSEKRRDNRSLTNISGESDLQLLNQNEELNKMDEMKKHIYDEV